MKKTRQSRSAGFSLIELLIAMVIVLVLVAGIAVAGERSMEAGRETSAVQSVQSLAANEQTYQRNWGGFSLLAANLGGAGQTAAATCTSDGEMVTTTTTNRVPAAFDSGVVMSGYKFTYKSGGTGFNGTGTCAQNVQPTYDIITNAVDGKTKNFCADSTGVVYEPAGTAMVATGIGCLADNPSAIPLGN